MRYFFLSFILLLSACQEPIPQGEAKRHMQKNAYLSQLLHDINNIVFERTFSELEKDELRILYAQDFVSEVDALMHDLQREQSFLIKAEAAPEKTKLFQSILSLLNQNNHELKKVISRYRPELIQPLVENSLNLCNSCHNSFRKE